MCTISINTLKMNRQVFWQKNLFTHIKNKFEENMQKRDPNSLDTNPIEPITKQEVEKIINN